MANRSIGKTIYWSSLNLFETCPQKFIWKYGMEGVDFGAGPGNPKPILTRRSEHDAIMGSAIQSAVEVFYKSGLWKKLRSPDLNDEAVLNLASELVVIAKEEFKKLVYDESRYVNWRLAPPYSDMEQTCSDGVTGYLKTVIANYLIGNVNEAEKHIVIKNANGTGVDIGAKIDVYIEKGENSRRNPGITIIDGKNSKSMGKYVSNDQLILYALCVYLESGRVPDRLGFVYYRYPFGHRISRVNVSKGVEWIKFKLDDMLAILDRAKAVRDKTSDPDYTYPAKPSPSVCRFCDWQDQCNERKIQIDVNRGSKGAGLFIDKDPDNDGFSDFSFDVNMIRGNCVIQDEPDEDHLYLTYLPEPDTDGFTDFLLGDALVGNEKEDKGMYKND